MRFSRTAATALLAGAALLLTGCETVSLSAGKKIDYKSISSGPALEIPPDLTSPQFDDRYTVTTASGAAARDANRPAQQSQIAQNQTPEARVVRAGTERWLVVKASPDQAWTTSRQFWTDSGFVLAIEQPNAGIMETDWAENRADIPQDWLRRTTGKVMDLFYTTYKRDKFRTRLERGVEPGTMEIYLSHRGMEQVPTTKIDNSSPAAFAWALMPPDPNLEAEMLTRLMVRFGAPQTQAAAAVAASSEAPQQARARVTKTADGVPQLVVDDSFDRAWRRVGLALDRVGFTVTDRDRSTGLYYVRYADPEVDMARKDRESGFLSKLMFWKDNTEKPEQYRIKVDDTPPTSVVTVQDPKGVPDGSPSAERILGLLRDQLK
jgi:outer membrane protein assembly factor BamC